MESVIVGVITLLIGIILGRIGNKPKHHGIVRVDASDANDAPYLFLVVPNEEAIYTIARKRFVTFKVEARNFNTQK